jgi:hypothetical protein
MSKGKIGIFCGEQHGDIGLCTAVLKYKDVLWPDKDIVWFANLAPEKATYVDMLKFNDAISEIRQQPPIWFRDIIDRDGHLLPEKMTDFEQTKDLDAGYYPAPWAVLPNPKLDSVNYSNIPRMVCGADPSWEWHSYLGFSDEEREMAKDFYASLPHAKTVMLETELRSAGNFQLFEDSTRNIIHQCRSKFGKCNFIFASKVDHTKFADDIGVVSGSQFTVRQTALLHAQCDLFIGVSSGITVAANCWGNKPVPRVEFCGSTIVSSIMAHGPVNSFICDNLTVEQKKAGLERTLADTLSRI